MKMMIMSASTFLSRRLLTSLASSSSSLSSSSSKRMTMMMVNFNPHPSRRFDDFGGGSNTGRRALSIQMGTGKTNDFSGKEKIEEEIFIRRTEHEQKLRDMNRRSEYERKMMALKYAENLKILGIQNEENEIETRRELHSMELRDILGVKYKTLPSHMISNLLDWKMDSLRNNY